MNIFTIFTFSLKSASLFCVYNALYIASSKSTKCEYNLNKIAISFGKKRALGISCDFCLNLISAINLKL